MLKAFGYALANAIDIDGNHYPGINVYLFMTESIVVLLYCLVCVDLLVGAYQSQRVVLFR